jgi:hypothetical protein
VNELKRRKETMANWDSMTLRGDSKEKFKEIMKDFDPKTRVRQHEATDESGEVYFSASPLPDEAVKELSAQLRVDSIIDGKLAKKNKGVMDNGRYGRG